MNSLARGVVVVHWLSSVLAYPRNKQIDFRLELRSAFHVKEASTSTTTALAVLSFAIPSLDDIFTMPVEASTVMQTFPSAAHLFVSQMLNANGDSFALCSLSLHMWIKLSVAIFMMRVCCCEWRGVFNLDQAWRDERFAIRFSPFLCGNYSKWKPNCYYPSELKQKSFNERQVELAIWLQSDEAVKWMFNSFVLI